jgi:pimeloyl-ACP methyl ester carboxylesterase
VRGVKRAETQVSPRVAPPVTLAVTEYGDRSSSTHVLMVHGFPDDQLMWEPVVSALPEDWHVVTYDVRGSGRSTKPDGRAAYRTELLVEDLVAVVEATVPAGEQFHLVGHDWGSIAGWEVVAAETWDPRLEGRLASYTSISGPSLDHLASLASSWRGRLHLLPQVWHSWYVWLFLVPVLPELAWRLPSLFRPLHLVYPSTSLLVWGPEVSANARHSVNLYRANILQHLRNPVAWRTSVPVQLVVANRDPWVTPRAVAGMEARCRRLSTVEVDEGHWLPRTKPTEFAELVAGFVRRQS